MSEEDHALVKLARSLVGWFSVGIVTLIMFPVLTVACLISFRAHQRARNLHAIVSLWAKLILFFAPMMRVTVEGGNQLKPEKTYILVANHQSLADILAVLHLGHPFKFIAKKELY